MRLGLILGEVGQGLRRNLSMVISVVLVTFISLTFVGAAILALVMFIPFIGWLAVLAVLLIGIGGLVIRLFSPRFHTRTEA